MSIQLNDDWRVVRDEEDCVYSLQQLEGDGWITRAKAGYRNQLLRRIGDWCGSVSEDSLKEIQQLPWRPGEASDGEVPA